MIVLNCTLFFATVIILIEHAFSECKEEDKLYQCQNSTKCIPIDWLCDRARDCPKGDDEFHASCGSSEDRGECEVFHFECIDPHSKKKKCARLEWRCDGFIDCMNGIDEVNCEPPPTSIESLPGQPTPPLFLPILSKAKESCKADEFQCKNGECIERDRVCDDNSDCKDDSDESEEKCSTPPLVPLIQPPTSNEISMSTSGKADEFESVKEQKILSTKTFSSTTKLEMKQQNFPTSFPPKLLFQTTKFQEFVKPIQMENVPNAVIMPITFEKPKMIFTTPPPLAFTIFTTPIFYNTIFNVKTTPLPSATTTKSIKMAPILSEKNPTFFHPKTTTHQFFTVKTEKSDDETIPIPIIPSQTDSKNPYKVSYKMSAERIKEKPEHFSVNSQSNVVTFSLVEKLEPIHPEIGIPIIPVNRFQTLFSMNYLGKGFAVELGNGTEGNTEQQQRTVIPKL